MSAIFGAKRAQNWLLRSIYIRPPGGAMPAAHHALPRNTRRDDASITNLATSTGPVNSWQGLGSNLYRNANFGQQSSSSSGHQSSNTGGQSSSSTGQHSGSSSGQKSSSSSGQSSDRQEREADDEDSLPLLKIKPSIEGFIEAIFVSLLSEVLGVDDKSPPSVEGVFLLLVKEIYHQKNPENGILRPTRITASGLKKSVTTAAGAKITRANSHSHQSQYHANLQIVHGLAQLGFRKRDAWAIVRQSFWRISMSALIKIQLFATNFSSRVRKIIDSAIAGIKEISTRLGAV